MPTPDDPRDPNTPMAARPPEGQAQEDTEAILSRRRFLIRSGLASAGLAVGGCDKGGKTPKGGGTEPMDKPGQPQVCLDAPRPRPDAAAPVVCLSKPLREPPPPAHPCLTPKEPERAPPKPMRKATVCLSKAKPRRRKRPQKTRARICLLPAD